MRPFKEYRIDESGAKVPYARWRGRIVENGGRVKVVLFTDLEASKRELRRLQSEADQRMQDPGAAARRKHGQRPIGEHVAEYVAFIERTTKSQEHHRIVRWMMERLVELTGWGRLDDISVEGVEACLKRLRLDERPATVAYCNCFIKRAKAFVNWCVPERLALNPLVKLKRGNVVRAEKRRAKRAATVGEVASLFAVLPEHYHLVVAFALLTGFRRSEQGELRWDDLRLNAPIPFIQLRSEWTKNDKADALPLHPVLVAMLRQLMPAMPAARVFRSIPDVATLRKYWGKAGVEFVVNGRRLDWHALRHTFSANLDAAGCSWITKKCLLRHACSDVTEGYSHARLAELLEAIKRLASPFAELGQAVATGTDGASVGGTDAGQRVCGNVHSDAASDRIGGVEFDDTKAHFVQEKQGVSAFRWMVGGGLDKVVNRGPSTQVD